MPLRSTIVGAATGVVLLAGVVGFAVGLPEIVGEEPEATEEQRVDTTPVAELLPESLLDGALTPAAEVSSKYSGLFEEIENYSSEKLTGAFESDVAVGIYSTKDQQVQVAVTIYDGTSGLFLQNGPPVPPEMSATSDNVSDVVRQGESVCIAQWQTQAFEQQAPPYQVQCQRTVAGRTINVYAVPGITAEQAADIVDDVAAQAGLG